MLRRVLTLIVVSFLLAPAGAVAQELADVPGVVLEVRSLDEGSHPVLWVWIHDDWRPVCAAPCERTVPTGAWQFGLSTRRDHWPSPVEGGLLEIADGSELVVDLASHALERIFGVIVGLVGLAGVGFGLAGILSPVVGDVVDPLRLIGGSVALALGVPGTVTGLWMIGLSDHSRVELHPR